MFTDSESLSRIFISDEMILKRQKSQVHSEKSFCDDLCINGMKKYEFNTKVFRNSTSHFLFSFYQSFIDTSWAMILSRLIYGFWNGFTGSSFRNISSTT